MTTMTIEPKHWYSWDFDARGEDGVSIDFDLSHWREKGVITVDGVEHRVFREGWMSGDFVMERDGQAIVRAEKPSAFRNAFIVSVEGRQYTLRKKSFARRAFVLMQGDTEVGSLAPDTFWKRRATVSLPADLPAPVRAFITWLAIILWKREADAAAAA